MRALAPGARCGRLSGSPARNRPTTRFAASWSGVAGFEDSNASMSLSTWLNTCRSRQRRCGRRRYSGQRLVNGDDRPPTTERLMATSFSPHRSLPWSRRTASSPRRTSAICHATFTQRSGGTSVPTPDRVSRSTSRLGRAAAERNCRPRAPDASNVLSQEPHHATPPSTAPSSSTSAAGPLGPSTPDAAETAVPGSALVGEPPARARRRHARRADAPRTRDAAGGRTGCRCNARPPISRRAADPPLPGGGRHRCAASRLLVDPEPPPVPVPGSGDGGLTERPQGLQPARRRDHSGPGSVLDRGRPPAGRRPPANGRDGTGRAS